MNETTKHEYLRNTKQGGEASELLATLSDKSVSLVFFDPQYEKVNSVKKIDYPLYFQSDFQISRIIQEIGRVLIPSGFGFLWVNKFLLGTDRILNWLLRSPHLKIVDVLVWYKKNTFGTGNYFRSQAEFAFLLQKHPYHIWPSVKIFENRKFSNVWEEKQISIKKRNHPHQKPFELIKALIEATTQEGDLIVDPCAGSFIVLEACQATDRQFLGCDLTFEELNEHRQEREREREREWKESF